MRRLLIILMTLLAVGVQAQRQQISFIEETKNWYYVYDEAGKKIGGLSRSSVGDMKEVGAVTSSWRSTTPSIASMTPKARC